MNGCVSVLEVDGTDVSVTAVREIEGGSETSCNKLTNGGRRAEMELVEETDLRIPNMRGIMMARKKPLTVVEAVRNSERKHAAHIIMKNQQQEAL